MNQITNTISSTPHSPTVLLRGGVEHVDEDQAEGDQQDDPGRHDVWRNEERHLDRGKYFNF